MALNHPHRLGLIGSAPCQVWVRNANVSAFQQKSLMTPGDEHSGLSLPDFRWRTRVVMHVGECHTFLWCSLISQAQLQLQVDGGLLLSRLGSVLESNRVACPSSQSLPRCSRRMHIGQFPCRFWRVPVDSPLCSPTSTPESFAVGPRLRILDNYAFAACNPANDSLKTLFYLWALRSR
ncbi:hypothetical protein BJX99DRAFT_224567 [Aspergillus californicus]